MFDLEQAIAKWRQEMAASGLAPEVLLELEEHLREDIDRQARSAVTTEMFQGALRRIGKPGALKSEFDLVRRPGALEMLRRHKWKLLLCLSVGLVAATLLHVLRPAPYQSEAILLVRVIGSGASSPAAGGVKLPPIRAEIMDEQMSILTSIDLLRKVARNIGPDKILKTAGGGEDINRATSLLKAGLRVVQPTNSALLHITFRNPDSALVQVVLHEVVDQFTKIHAEVKRDPLAWGQISNIIRIQQPSPPFSSSNGALFRMQALVVFAAFLVAAVWILVERLTGTSMKLVR